MCHKKHSRIETAISANMHFKTIVRDRDVNLRLQHFLHTLRQNSDKFECLFVSKLSGEC